MLGISCSFSTFLFFYVAEVKEGLCVYGLIQYANYSLRHSPGYTPGNLYTLVSGFSFGADACFR